MIVRVDEVGALILMAGEMHLLHALERNAGEEGMRIEFMIDAAHVDIVDVEQQQTVGGFRRVRRGIPTR